MRYRLQLKVQSEAYRNSQRSWSLESSSEVANPKDRRPDRSPCIHDRRQSSGLPFLSGIQAHGHRGRSQSEEHQKIGISDIP